eukprot:540566-Prorocentrum_lima.AAC.1
MVRRLGEHHEGKLHASLVAKVRVNAVIAAEEHGDVLRVDRSAEELHTVIQVVGHFDVVHRGPRAHAGEGDAVDLVVLADDFTTVPHADVLE